MNLKKSNKKTPEDLKNEIKSILDPFSVNIKVSKDIINTENYKFDKKDLPEIPEKQGLNLGSIKKELLQPLKIFIDNKISSISQQPTNLIKNILNSKDVKQYKTENNNFETKENILNNQKIIKHLNIDYKTLFKPSENIKNQINQKFTNSKNINLRNITKNQTYIPAMQKGGVVKEPMVSYLHENEAVVPLKDSPQFKDLIKLMNNEVVKNISKNETIKNVSTISNNNRTSSIRNSLVNNETMKSETVNKKYENKTQNETSVNNFSFGNIIGQGPDSVESDSPTIPIVYGGSTSKEVFMTRTVSTPSWRNRIG